MRRKTCLRSFLSSPSVRPRSIILKQSVSWQVPCLESREQGLGGTGTVRGQGMRLQTRRHRMITALCPPAQVIVKPRGAIADSAYDDPLYVIRRIMFAGSRSLRQTILWCIALVVGLPPVSYAAVGKADPPCNPACVTWRGPSEQAEPLVAQEGSTWHPLELKHDRSTKRFDCILHSIRLPTSADPGRTGIALPDSDPFAGDQLLELLRSFACDGR
jgi:hypothetical protein